MIFVIVLPMVNRLHGPRIGCNRVRARSVLKVGDVQRQPAASETK
jgi:hypothetical protein